MTPDPDATAAPPPEHASVPAALSDAERRAVEAAVAGAAGLLLGRVLLGRAGGLATGLAALGAGLLGKCPPARPKTPAAEPGTNGVKDSAGGSNGTAAHEPPAAAFSELETLMRVRLQTSPIPPLNAVTALAQAEAMAAENFPTLAVTVPVALAPLVPVHVPVPVSAVVPEPVAQTIADVLRLAEIEEPPAAVEEKEEAAVATMPEPVPVMEPEPEPEPELEPAQELVPVPEPEHEPEPVMPPAVPNEEEIEDAGAFAEIPALFESEPAAAPAPPELEVSYRMPPAPAVEPLPLAALLQQAESELESTPPPAAAPVLPVPRTSPVSLAAAMQTPAGKTSPVIGLLEDLPVEFAELKEEQEPGLRGDFLIVPDETPKPVPDLQPVVAALSVPLTSFEKGAPSFLTESVIVESVPSAAAVALPEEAVEPAGDAALPVFAPSEPEVAKMEMKPESRTAPVGLAPESPVPPAPDSAPWPVPEPVADKEPAYGPDDDLDGVPPFPQSPASFLWPVVVAPEKTQPVPVILPPPADTPFILPVRAPVPVPVDTAPVAPDFPVTPATAPVAPALPVTPATAPVEPVPPVPPATAPVAEITPPSPATAPVVAPVTPIALATPADLAVLLQSSASPFPAAAAIAPWTIDPEKSPSVPPLPADETIPVSLPPIPPGALPARVPAGQEMPEASAPQGDSPFLMQRPAEGPGRARPDAGKPGAGADPEEIWRQAAAELATYRTDPVPPSFPPPVGAPGAAPFPVAPDTSLAPPFPAAVPAPIAAPTPGTAPAPGAPPAELPPWLKSIAPQEPAPGAEPKGHDAKPFLPTIRLAVPQGPQSMAARRPVPLPDAPPPETTPVRPIPLPGYRAESVTTVVPPADAQPPAPADTAPVMAAPAPAVAPVALPPLPLHASLPQLPEPVAAAPILPARTAPAAVLPMVVLPTAVPAPAPDDKVYVERHKSRRASPAYHKKKTVTPLRVGLVALLAIAALCLAFKDTLVPWLRQVWEQRIQGKTPRKPAPAPGPEVPTPPPSDSPDVKVVPEANKKPAPAVPVTPPASPATPTPDTAPAPEPAPPAATPEGAASNAVPPMPDTEPLPVPPPAAAPDNSNEPLPVTEAGAKELVGRLLYATAPQQVRPLILDEASLGPGVDSYFSSGKPVPISSHVCELTRSEKIPGTSRMMWQFKVTTDTVEGGFPVLVEQTANGLRADWELLSQCRDMQFQKWMADPKAGPARFYTGLQRRHPFPDMLPGRDPNKFLAFAIAAPILGEPPSMVYIPVGAPLAARAAKLYDFSTPLQAPVLELAHKGPNYVEIIAIVRENWRSAGRK